MVGWQLSQLTRKSGFPPARFSGSNLQPGSTAVSRPRGGGRERYLHLINVSLDRSARSHPRLAPTRRCSFHALFLCNRSEPFPVGHRTGCPTVEINSTGGGLGCSPACFDAFAEQALPK